MAHIPCSTAIWSGGGAASTADRRRVEEGERESKSSTRLPATMCHLQGRTWSTSARQSPSLYFHAEAFVMFIYCDKESYNHSLNFKKKFCTLIVAYNFFQTPELLYHSIQSVFSAYIMLFIVE